jgi:hypothetical protein
MKVTLEKDKKHKGYFRCCPWDDCPGNKGSRPIKTKAEERLIKTTIKYLNEETIDNLYKLEDAIEAVLKERKKK